ncbi:MAG: hypothetical protein CMG57_06725 [Candidatus Marinimicrobia bacterium]|nr:hypothetical protein [Candidatus Neomarinimicrobiota bacterium]
MRRYLLPILFVSLLYWSCEESTLPEDCSGVEDGSALVDSCGICDDDPSNDCLLDCSGEWGGMNICGCTENTATNYDSTATFDDGSCISGLTCESYYNENISPIFSNNCYTCHSGSTTSGGLNLSLYINSLNAMETILDRVTREEGSGGFMPPGSSKLTQSEISILLTFLEMDCE